MALKIGRLAYLGIGIESTPGTAVSAETALPFISNTLKGKHEPITDISSRGSRFQNFTSVTGKKWSEGDVEVNVDFTNIGYLFALGLGTEAVVNKSSGVYDHVFYTTVSGNNPKTATLYNYQGLDVQRFKSMALDKIDVQVSDSLMTARATFKGLFPDTGAYSNTTVSGTLAPYNRYSVKLGSTLATASASSAIATTDFMFSIENNVENIFEAGDSESTRVFSKNQVITGSFTRFFEEVTDRDNYYNLNKQAILVTVSGNGIGGGMTEELKIQIAKAVYEDQEIDTGTDNFFAIKTNFRAEVDLSQNKTFDIILRNRKTTAYGS